MAYLALHGSGAVNGVSRLARQVSRHMFEPLFPRWPVAEVPVGHITNGVHVPSWDSAEADDLWTNAGGKDRWLGTTETLERDIRGVSDADLWHFRTAAARRWSTSCASACRDSWPPPVHRPRRLLRRAGCSIPPR